MLNEKTVFTEIARNKVWGKMEAETVSGPGSTMRETQKLRAALPLVFGSLRIRTLVDAPCGDRNWIRHLEYTFLYYIGVDIVEELIAKLNAEDYPDHYNFQVGNIVTDVLPVADALFSRDCLVHLPNRMVWGALRRFKLAGFSYLFATTFPDHSDNPEIALGDWRPMNLQAAPFCFPTPLTIIPERGDDPTDQYNDKSLAVWNVRNIPDVATC